MKTIMAVYNAGRWIVHCPKHGVLGAVLAEACQNHEIPHQSSYHVEGGEYVCPVCYPKITAVLPAQRNGAATRIPDRSARNAARLQARENGEAYTVVYPENKDEIIAVLNERPSVLLKNWDGAHETVGILRTQNHIMENYRNRKEVVSGDEFGVTRKR